MRPSHLAQTGRQQPDSPLVLKLYQCVDSPLNVALSGLVLFAVGYALWLLLPWLFFDAIWQGTSAKECLGYDSACWVFIYARADQLLYGSYPIGERWRLWLALLLGVLTVFTLCRGALEKSLLWLSAVLAVSTLMIGALLVGGVLGLRVVSSQLWGGATLTLVIAAWTIATALPLGLLLALARRSELPVVSMLVASCVDVIRSLPLVGLLFLMIVMFPFFVPVGVEPNKLIRALIAFTLFNAANFSEVFRGGLQTIGAGQYEAGYSVGLSKWRTTQLIVLPQVLAISVPGMVNVCISIVKETTVVLILGLFDLLGVLQSGIGDPDWLAVESVRTTSYVFAALVYWLCCFSLSRYSASLERRAAGRSQA